MGMPVIVEVVDPRASELVLEQAFTYLGYVDRKFSTYKPDSEISLINRHVIPLEQSSEDMKQ